jgi:hypothetical protein
MRTFIKIAGSVLLTVSCVTASDARQHARQQPTTQRQTIYDNSDYNNTRGQDSSCFNSTGLPELYACSGNGGG